MRILVTGANGYIGSNVAKRLFELGYDIICVDFDNNHLDKAIPFYKCNISEFKDSLYSKLGKPDTCIHLAWRDGFKQYSENHFGDLPGHKRFLEYLIKNGIKNISVMGTAHEVGYYEGKVDPTTPCNPVTPYGKAKVELRLFLEELKKKYSFNLMWLRAFYIYSNNDLIGNSIFAKISQAALRGETTFPFTNGVNKFDFIQMEDLIEQIIAASTQNYETGVINVCSGKPLSLGEKVEAYIKDNNLQIKLNYGVFKEREDESPCFYGDNSIIQRILYRRNQKVLVTGSKGQLGFACLEELNRRGYLNVYGLDKDIQDITDKNGTIQYVQNIRPNIIIHNAAWTAVDKAEMHPDETYDVNVNGTQYLVDVAKEIDALFVHISTNYVFDGSGKEPFETQSVKKPLSIYGKTKAISEDIVTNNLQKYYILRTSWLIGVHGKNFVNSVLKNAHEHKEISVVCDQIGSPTFAFDMSKTICDMIETDKYGIYHITNEGECSFADLAEYIFRKLGVKTIVHPITTKDYEAEKDNQATRPLNSRLSKRSLIDNGFNLLPVWQKSLDIYLEEYKKHHGQ